MSIEFIANEVTSELIVGKLAVAKPELLILMGLQYSGKSTLAQEVEKHNYIHFWATNVKKKYKIANPEMFEVAKLVCKLLLSKGYNVLLDYVNHKYSKRQDFESLVSKMDLGYKLIYLNVPFEELLRRREQNAARGDQPGRRVISVEQMEEFKADFEPPQDSEHFIELKTNEDIKQFLGTLAS